MTKFDWHTAPLSRDTPVTADFRLTQNVRRFLTRECGSDFKAGPAFHAWIRSGAAQTLGDVADHWSDRRAD